MSRRIRKMFKKRNVRKPSQLSKTRDLFSKNIPIEEPNFSPTLTRLWGDRIGLEKEGKAQWFRTFSLQFIKENSNWHPESTHLDLNELHKTTSQQLQKEITSGNAHPTELLVEILRTLRTFSEMIKKVNKNTNSKEYIASVADNCLAFHMIEIVARSPLNSFTLVTFGMFKELNLAFKSAASLFENFFGRFGRTEITRETQSIILIFRFILKWFCNIILQFINVKFLWDQQENWSWIKEFKMGTVLNNLFNSLLSFRSNYGYARTDFDAHIAIINLINVLVDLGHLDIKEACEACILLSQSLKAPDMTMAVFKVDRTIPIAWMPINSSNLDFDSDSFSQENAPFESEEALTTEFQVRSMALQLVASIVRSKPEAESVTSTAIDDTNIADFIYWVTYSFRASWAISPITLPLLSSGLRFEKGPQKYLYKKIEMPEIMIEKPSEELEQEPKPIIPPNFPHNRHLMNVFNHLEMLCKASFNNRGKSRKSTIRLSTGSHKTQQNVNLKDKIIRILLNMFKQSSSSWANLAQPHLITIEPILQIYVLSIFSKFIEETDVKWYRTFWDILTSEFFINPHFNGPIEGIEIMNSVKTMLFQLLNYFGTNPAHPNIEEVRALIKLIEKSDDLILAGDAVKSLLTLLRHRHTETQFGIFQMNGIEIISNSINDLKNLHHSLTLNPRKVPFSNEQLAETFKRTINIFDFLTQSDEIKPKIISNQAVITTLVSLIEDLGTRSFALSKLFGLISAVPLNPNSNWINACKILITSISKNISNSKIIIQILKKIISGVSKKPKPLQDVFRKGKIFDTIYTIIHAPVFKSVVIQILNLLKILFYNNRMNILKFEKKIGFENFANILWNLNKSVNPSIINTLMDIVGEKIIKIPQIVSTIMLLAVKDKKIWENVLKKFSDLTKNNLTNACACSHMVPFLIKSNGTEELVNNITKKTMSVPSMSAIFSLPSKQVIEILSSTIISEFTDPMYIYFDGTNEIEMNNFPMFPSNFTINLWIDCIFHEKESIIFKIGDLSMLTRESHILLKIKSNEVKFDISIGKWSLISTVYQNGSISIYVNAEKVVEVENLTTPISNGKLIMGSESFEGKIASFSIIPSKKTLRHINRIYKEGFDYIPEKIIFAIHPRATIDGRCIDIACEAKTITSSAIVVEINYPLLSLKSIGISKIFYLFSEDLSTPFFELFTKIIPFFEEDILIIGPEIINYFINNASVECIEMLRPLLDRSLLRKYLIENVLLDSNTWRSLNSIVQKKIVQVLVEKRVQVTPEDSIRLFDEFKSVRKDLLNLMKQSRISPLIEYCATKNSRSDILEIVLEVIKTMKCEIENDPMPYLYLLISNNNHKVVEIALYIVNEIENITNYELDTSRIKINSIAFTNSSRDALLSLLINEMGFIKNIDILPILLIMIKNSQIAESTLHKIKIIIIHSQYNKRQVQSYSNLVPDLLHLLNSNKPNPPLKFDYKNIMDEYLNILGEDITNDEQKYELSLLIHEEISMGFDMVLNEYKEYLNETEIKVDNLISELCSHIPKIQTSINNEVIDILAELICFSIETQTKSSFFEKTVNWIYKINSLILEFVLNEICEKLKTRLWITEVNQLSGLYEFIKCYSVFSLYEYINGDLQLRTPQPKSMRYLTDFLDEIGFFQSPGKKKVAALKLMSYSIAHSVPGKLAEMFGYPFQNLSIVQRRDTIYAIMPILSTSKASWLLKTLQIELDGELGDMLTSSFMMEKMALEKEIQNMCIDLMANLPDLVENEPTKIKKVQDLAEDSMDLEYVIIKETESSYDRGKGILLKIMGEREIGVDKMIDSSFRKNRMIPIQIPPTSVSNPHTRIPCKVYDLENFESELLISDKEIGIQGVFKFKIEELLSIFKTDYHLLFFFSNKENYYISVTDPIQILKKLPNLKIEPSFRDSLNPTLWQEQKISNFHYLMWLNMLAGRNYNNFEKYPILPNVLVDSLIPTSKEISKEEVFRQLSKVYHKSEMTELGEPEFYVPELYSLPHTVQGIKLPSFVRNAGDFILSNRKKLESNDFSRNIHEWIDHIFGYQSIVQVVDMPHIQRGEIEEREFGSISTHLPKEPGNVVFIGNGYNLVIGTTHFQAKITDTLGLILENPNPLCIIRKPTDELFKVKGTMLYTSGKWNTYNGFRSSCISIDENYIVRGLENGNIIYNTIQLVGHPSEVLSISVNSDFDMIVSSSKNKLMIHSIRNNTIIHESLQGADKVLITRDSIYTFNLIGKVVRMLTLSGHNINSKSIPISCWCRYNDKVIAGLDNGSIIVLEMLDIIKSIQVCNQPILSIYLEDNKIICGSNNQLNVISFG